NRIALEEFNRWAAPLDDNIARAVAGNLAILLGTPRVATGPLVPNLGPAYRVAIDVQRFESVPGETVLVDAVWAVRKPAGRDARPRSGTLARCIRMRSRSRRCSSHACSRRPIPYRPSRGTRTLGSPRRIRGGPRRVSPSVLGGPWVAL